MNTDNTNNIIKSAHRGSKYGENPPTSDTFKPANVNHNFVASNIADEGNADRMSAVSKDSRVTTNTHGSEQTDDEAGLNLYAGKPIADTLTRRFTFMMGCHVALVMNILFLAVVIGLNSKGGIVLNLNAVEFTHFGPLIAIVWSRIAYIQLDAALNRALGAYFGYYIASPQGYSIAACGFIHSNFGEKLSFSNALSFRSPIKRLISRFSMIFLYHLVTLVAAMLASPAIHIDTGSADGTSLMCIEYKQLGFHDRGLPILNSEMGGAEYIDTQALASTRFIGQDERRNSTAHIMPPQLIDICLDGSTIVGQGFITELSTTCNCTYDYDVSSLLRVNVPSSQAAQMRAMAMSLDDDDAWVNAVSFNNDTINVYTMILGNNVCGGLKSPGKPRSFPLCQTKIWNHRRGKIQARYKTDGTPASIAVTHVLLLSGEEELEKSDMSILHQAVLNVFGGAISYNYLPAHFTGSVNPFLWLATTNMQEISLPLLEPGMEVAQSYVLRAAIQRSYSADGGVCVQRVPDTTTATLTISEYGYLFAIPWICSQLVLNFLAYLLFMPWLFSEKPVLPAVLMAQQHIIFSLISSKNFITSSRMKVMSSNLEAGVVWSRLDIVLRLGESLTTLEDPQRGNIILDKPALVGDLCYEKEYI